MFTTDRSAMRRAFTEAWLKHRSGQPVQPLEQLIADTVAQHPEYHSLLETPEALEREFPPESGRTNPFLHLSMHLALREQIGTDRPRGISALYRRMLGSWGDPHEVEHQLMECLGRMLWEVQHDQRPFDEDRYLECIREIAGQPR